MRAKKSLGQNFLKSEAALRKIIEVSEIKKEDTVLEIGPGKGILTEKLLECVGKVIAVEKDSALVELLQEKFAKEIASGKLELLEEDILSFTPPQNYKIVANIPYNITGAILKKFLGGDPKPELMTLMVQQEVAERIVAKDKKESLLSISVKAYGEPKIIMKVPARYFSPKPKVDSAILLIKNISRKFFEENKVSEEKFWQIVKKAFAHKRKKLSGNLKSEVPATKLAPFGNKRAEDLTLHDWKELVA